MPADRSPARLPALVSTLLLLLGSPAFAAPAGTSPAPPADGDAGSTPPDSTAAPAEWLPRTTAELRVLDTQSAQASTLVLDAGQTRQVGSLAITLRACRVRPPDQRSDAAALLDVVDAKGAGVAFHGWMLAAEPQLAVLENPGYGLLLVGCR